MILGVCVNHAWMLLDQLALRMEQWRFERIESLADDQYPCEFCPEPADYVARAVAR